MNTTKMDRVDDEIRKTLNEIIAYELKDPRLETLINVTAVNTTKDLKSAKVFVSIMDKSKAKDALAALKNASGFIRGILFEKLKIRLVPHLTFHLDESLNRGFAIENILKEMHAVQNDSDSIMKNDVADMKAITDIQTTDLIEEVIFEPLETVETEFTYLDLTDNYDKVSKTISDINSTYETNMAAAEKELFK